MASVTPNLKLNYSQFLSLVVCSGIKLIPDRQMNTLPYCSRCSTKFIILFMPSVNLSDSENRVTFQPSVYRGPRLTGVGETRSIPASAIELMGKFIDISTPRTLQTPPTSL